jgi:hypothetical protein
MKGIHLPCIFLLTFALPLLAATKNLEPIDECVANLENISSYDVFFRVDSLQFSNFGDTNKLDNVTGVAFTWTNRDVFDNGVGRRIEDHVGDNAFHVISVINWKSAISTGKPLALALTRSLPGFTYHDYLNPIVGNLFLTELLHAKDSEISPVATNVALRGTDCYQIVNPKMNGILIKVWLDPKRGYIPRRVEWFQKRKDGKFIISEKLNVEKVIQITGGAWVPARATNTRIMTSGTTIGRSYSGQTIEIDPDRSSWESVKSDKLFLAKSLPVVNLETEGWKCYYPPSMLANARAALGLPSEIEIAKRHLILAVFVIVVLLPLLITTFRMLKMKSRVEFR